MTLKDKIIEKAKKRIKDLERAGADQRVIDFSERELRDLIDIYETGYEKGKEEGRELARLEKIEYMIINLFKMNMLIEQIMEMTGASRENLEIIKKKNLL